MDILFLVISTSFLILSISSILCLVACSCWAVILTVLLLIESSEANPAASIAGIAPPTLVLEKGAEGREPAPSLDEGIVIFVTFLALPPEAATVVVVVYVFGVEIVAVVDAAFVAFVCMYAFCCDALEVPLDPAGLVGIGLGKTSESLLEGCGRGAEGFLKLALLSSIEGGGPSSIKYSSIMLNEAKFVIFGRSSSIFSKGALRVTVATGGAFEVTPKSMLELSSELLFLLSRVNFLFLLASSLTGGEEVEGSGDAG